MTPEIDSPVLPFHTFRPQRAHVPRPFIGLGHRRIGDWLVKGYAITASGGAPSPAVLRQAAEIAERQLPAAGDGSRGHGVAFTIAHEGRDGDYVVLCWWTDQNMLSQQIHRAPPGRHAGFERFDLRDIVTCVWEVQVIAHEAQQWVHHVLSRTQPDVEGYLANQLGGRL